MKFLRLFCCSRRRHDIQYNDTQHNNKNATLSIMALDIAKLVSYFAECCYGEYCYAEYCYAVCC